MPKKTFMNSDFIAIDMHRKFYSIAKAYGNLVHRHSLLPGAHNTPAAEPQNHVLSHVKGKYGELAFLKWLMNDEGMLPSHTPFRNDYTQKVEQDDFIVNGIQIEVKAKRRDKSPFPPHEHYNVNLGKSGLEDALYAFIEIDPGGAFEDGPRCLLLGWADSARIRAIGKQLHPGTTSDNGNFSFARHDWDIPINGLYKPKDLIDRLQESRDRPSIPRG